MLKSNHLQAGMSIQKQEENASVWETGNCHDGCFIRENNVNVNIKQRSLQKAHMKYYDACTDITSLPLGDTKYPHGDMCIQGVDNNKNLLK